MILSGSYLSKYIYQIIGRGLPQGLSLFLNSLFIQYIGVENFAVYSIVLLYFSAAFTLLAGGADVVFQQINKMKCIVNILFYKLFSFILIFFPITVFLYYFYEIDFVTICMLMIGFFIQAVVESYITAFRIIEKDKYVVFPKVFQLTGLFILLMTYKPSSLYEFSFFFLISWIIVLLIYSNIMVSNIKVIEFKFLNFLNSNKRKLFYIGFSIFSTQIYMNVDFITLEYFFGREMAGNYKVALILSQSILAVIGALSVVLLSNFSNIDKKNHITYLLELRKAIKHQIFLITLISIFFIIFAIIIFDDIFIIFFPKISIDYVDISIVLILASIINGYSMILSYFLLHINQEKMIFLVTIYTVVFSITTSLLVIKYFSLYGAVFTNILIQLFIFLIYFYIANKKFKDLTCVE